MKNFDLGPLAGLSKKVHSSGDNKNWCEVRYYLKEK